MRARERASLLLGYLLGIASLSPILLGIWSPGIRPAGSRSNGKPPTPGAASLAMLGDGGHGRVYRADLVVLGLNRQNEMEEVQLKPAQIKALRGWVKSLRTSGKSNVTTVVRSTEGVLRTEAARAPRGSSSGVPREPPGGSKYPCSNAEQAVVVWTPCRIWRHSGACTSATSVRVICVTFDDARMTTF